MTVCIDPILLHHPENIGTVRFHWTGDRFEHVVQLGKREFNSAELLQSANWPASPPVQQLSVETIADRKVALGVGCAGTSHWSVSVEPTDAGFRFDWACRAKSIPERLGSTYQNVGGLTAGTGFQFDAEADSILTVDQESLSICPRQSLISAGTYRWSYRVQCQ